MRPFSLPVGCSPVCSRGSTSPSWSGVMPGLARADDGTFVTAMKRINDGS